MVRETPPSSTGDLASFHELVQQQHGTCTLQSATHHCMCHAHADLILPLAVFGIHMALGNWWNGKCVQSMHNHPTDSILSCVQRSFVSSPSADAELCWPVRYLHLVAHLDSEGLSCMAAAGCRRC